MDGEKRQKLVDKADFIEDTPLSQESFGELDALLLLSWREVRCSQNLRWRHPDLLRVYSVAFKKLATTSG